MSIRMLDATQEHFKQTIQDDMESLLYVVLYCALLWQPHNLSRQELTSTVSAFFDQSYKHANGEMQGGSAKFANAKRRLYTLRLVFNSSTFHDWLLTVQNYHSPLPMHGNKYDGKWSDPDHLDTYWSSFLQTRTLEPDNRVEHSLDMFDHYGLLSTSTIFSVPRTQELGPSRSKRRSRVQSEHEPVPEEPIAKRVRSRMRSKRDRASSAPPTSTSRDPRRSKRIQQQELAETQQSAPKRPTTVPAAQSTSRGRKRVRTSTRK